MPFGLTIKDPAFLGGGEGNLRCAITTLLADNAAVEVGAREYIRLQSDSASVGTRTFTLTAGNKCGQLLLLEWVGSNVGNLVNGAALSGSSGNVRLSADWEPAEYDTLLLTYNGLDWVEAGREGGAATTEGDVGYGLIFTWDSSTSTPAMASDMAYESIRANNADEAAVTELYVRTYAKPILDDIGGCRLKLEGSIRDEKVFYTIDSVTVYGSNPSTWWLKFGVSYSYHTTGGDYVFDYFTANPNTVSFSLMGTTQDDFASWFLGAQHGWYALQTFVNGIQLAPNNVTLTADNTEIEVQYTNYIYLDSDNATASNRTFTLKNTYGGEGTFLILHFHGANACELLDGSGSGQTVKLRSDWTPVADDILVVMFDGTDFVEVCRSPVNTGGVTGLANPTAEVDVTAVNGVATTAMRSDAAPALRPSADLLYQQENFI